MQIGVPRDNTRYEKRVAVTPDTIKKYLKAGHNVVVEKDAGAWAFIANEALIQAGATVVDNAIIDSEVILTVNRLPLELRMWY